MPAASGSPERASGETPALVPGACWRREFPGEERQLGVLRRWLATLLPDCPARDDVTLAATELGTNALVHTASGHGGWFAVQITWHPAVVRVAVADCGAPGGPRWAGDPAGEHGRGLLVVQGLSARTGVCGDLRGRLVWADIPWGDARSPAHASPQDPYEASVHDGHADLASRFAGVPAWFGRSTLQWWALAGGELVTAPSAQELADLLGAALDPPTRWPLPGRDLSYADAGAGRVAGREQRPGASALRLRPGRADSFGLRTRVQPAVV